MSLTPALTRSTIPTFVPAQIICLEHETSRLYAEVVQITEGKRICWARPLMLVQGVDPNAPFFNLDNACIYDLRQGSDVLLPETLFREAFDTEVIPLLARLAEVTDDASNPCPNQLGLSAFIQQICTTYSDVFQTATADRINTDNSREWM